MGRITGRISPFADQRRALVALLAGNELAAQWLESRLVIYRRTPKGRLSELVDRGEYGVEARIVHDEEPLIWHIFAPWPVAPFATPRDGDSLGGERTEGN
jgi:hypothetical protein